MTASQLNLDHEVGQLINRYISVTSLHPVMSQLVGIRPELQDAFDNSLVHEFATLQQRSDDLSRGEMTKSQKAFKILMYSQMHTSAIALWIEEILGLKSISERGQEQVLAATILNRGHVLCTPNPQRFVVTTELIPFQKSTFLDAASPPQSRMSIPLLEKLGNRRVMFNSIA